MASVESCWLSGCKGPLFLEEMDTMSEQPAACIRAINGQLVLDGPAALGVFRDVAKHNCGGLFDANAERIQHFARRVQERGLTAQEVVITVINVDDVHGRILADMLLPGHDWQAYRDRGEIPVARGLSGRDGIQGALALIDADAAKKLQEAAGLCVVVVDQGTAEVYQISQETPCASK